MKDRQFKKTAMIIRIPVGHAERHEVIFELCSSLDLLQVTIDGSPSIFRWELLPFLPLRSVAMDGLAHSFRFSSPMFSRFMNYFFIVGRDELHQVRIEQETNPWFGPLLKERFCVYVDNILVQEQSG